MIGTLEWIPLLHRLALFADTMKTLHETIIEKLEIAFSPTFLELVDETHKHYKHKQFQIGKSHFKLHIASEKLATLSTLKAHKEIYMCLGELMHSQIHALSIQIDKKSNS